MHAAHRNYELDYLATSLGEALQVANEVASTDAMVYVSYPWEYVWPAARLISEIMTLLKTPSILRSPNSLC